MSIRPIQNINSLYTLKRNAEHLGNHFFDADTLRFFSSRVSEQIYRVDDSRGYFVTSEENVGYGPRLYSVRAYEIRAPHTPRPAREQDEIMETHTVGTFQGYGTAREAHTRAAELQGYARIDPAAFTHSLK